MVDFCLFVLLLFVVCFLVFSASPFLATMSFPGYFHVQFLLSAFLFFFFSLIVFVSGLFSFSSVNRVTAAGFVADQLM